MLLANAWIKMKILALHANGCFFATHQDAKKIFAELAGFAQCLHGKASKISRGIPYARRKTTGTFHAAFNTR